MTTKIARHMLLPCEEESSLSCRSCPVAVGGYGASVIVIPESFARSTVEREGEPGMRWLAELPSIVDELLERWECVPDGEIMHGGVGIIVPVRRQADGPAVVKVSFPHPGNVHEPDAFVAWAGRGAVQLHERDGERFAMLLERAHDATLLEAADGDEAAAVAGQVCRRLAIPAPADLPRLLAIFAEAAELDRERAHRWAQFHAVRASFWGRRHGFGLARSGSRLDAITEYADRLTQLL
jgi:hypothetical protein